MALKPHRGSMDTPLSPDDFNRLYEKYFPARAQWNDIGCALEIGADDLDAIDRNHRGKCEDCFREVLLNWLRNGEEKTESKLAQVINKVTQRERRHISELGHAVKGCSLLGSILLMALLVGYTVYVKYTNNLTTIIAAAQTLKVLYKHQPVVEFELLDYTTNIPYSNVTMSNASTSESLVFWELLSDLDLKHKQLQDTAQPGDLERILITGHPGAGKTTLMRYLAKEWANGKRLQSCKVLFLVQLGCLSKDRNPQSLSDLLELSPYKDLDLKGLSREIQQSEGAGACFLLDSYDEWIWRKDFIHQLFFEFNLHSSLCIMTSRPFKYSKISGIKSITMSGFKSANLEKYLKALSTDARVINSIVSLWNSNDFIKEMCTLPLNMAMLISIVTNDDKLVLSTRTEIYSAFLNVTVNHFINRHPDWNTISLWECILNKSSNKLCTAFKRVHHVAFEMFFNGADTFDDHEEFTSDINKLGFVNITKVKSNGNEVRYTFYHPTFQEFFAAIHLLGLNQEELLYLYIRKYDFDRHHYSLKPWTNNLAPWLFYFGLIGAHCREDNVSVILRQLSMYRKLKDYCYYHPLTLEYIKEIGWTGKKLDELLETTGIVINSTLYVELDVDALGYVINHTTVIHKLVIRASYSELHLEGRISYAQLESLESCTLFGLPHTQLAIPSITHIHCDLTFKLDICECFSKAAINLHSLNIYLVDSICHFQSLKQFFDRLDSLINRLKNLQSLNLKFKLSFRYNCSLFSIDLFKNILLNKHQLIRNLEITIIRINYDSSVLKLFINEITNLQKLQKFAFTGAKEWMGTKLLRVIHKSSSTLQHLNLCRNKINDTFVAVIAQELKGLHNLKSLRLCQNSITGTGSSLKTLVEALDSHRNFLSLDLSDNPISNKNGIKALGNLKTLRELGLMLTKTNIEEVVNVLLSNNITLHSLKLGSRCDGIENLVPLGQLTDLQYLDISNVEIWPHELKHDMLVELLKNLIQLESFTLCNWYQYNKYWSIELANVISHQLPKLRLFYAPCFRTWMQTWIKEEVC